MDLKSFLDSLPPGGRALFARQVGVAPAFLSQMAHGHRPVPIKHASKIVKASRGRVALVDLYPELAGARR